MHDNQTTRKSQQRGFSMIELLIVILVITIISGTIFSSINDAQKASAAEQAKLDSFQQSREFLDQMMSDLRNVGYPNSRNFATDKSPTNFDNAVGLVKMDVGDLWFEGDVNGTGTVSVIRYHLTPDGPNCPCLRRSESAKIEGDPVTGQGDGTYMVEVQSVANDVTANPIFTAYLPDGTAIPLPIDFDNNASVMSQINSIKVTLQVKSQHPDAVTQQYTSMTLVSSAKLNNCSQAHAGMLASCQ